MLRVCLTTIIAATVITQAMAQTYTGNPDSMGLFWEGPIRFGSLLIRPWMGRISQAGGNVTGLKFYIEDGTVYLNRDHLAMGLDSEAYMSCARNVSTTASGVVLQLTQLDYFAYSTDPNIEWIGLALLDQEQLVHSNIQMEGSGLLAINIEPSVDLGDDYGTDNSLGDGSKSTSLAKRSGSDIYTDFESPSATNPYGRRTCYAAKNACVNTAKGYRVVTGSAYVSGINWMIGWSHHYCNVSCRDNYYNYLQVFHKYRRYSIRLTSCKNIYSAGMATQRPAPNIRWGAGKSQYSCGPWSGQLPACDAMPIGQC